MVAVPDRLYTEQMVLEWLKYIVGPSILVGLWELYKFIRSRTFASRLKIEVGSTATPLGERYLVFVDVQLTNFGRGKIQARPLDASQVAYEDAVETVRYSGSLQVRQIEAGSIDANGYVDWFRSAAVKPLDGVPEINLLDEYTLPDENDRVEFWLEPDEVVNLGAPIVLSPGHYLLKVSFYGPESDDFWHKLEHVYLPPVEQTIH